MTESEIIKKMAREIEFLTELVEKQNFLIERFLADQEAASTANAHLEQTEMAKQKVKTLQFLTDVVTASGLLRYGKTDKRLAQRISDAAYEMRYKECL